MNRHQRAGPTILYVRFECPACARADGAGRSSDRRSRVGCVVVGAEGLLATRGLAERQAIREIVLQGKGLVACRRAWQFVAQIARATPRLVADLSNLGASAGPRLLTADFDEAWVQLDSPDGAVHDAVHDAPGAHSASLRVLCAADMARSNGIELVARTTIRAENHGTVWELARILAASACRSWEWTLPVAEPYSLLTETQVRTFYESLDAVEDFCRSSGIDLRVPRQESRAPDLRVLGITQDEIASSSVAVFPANGRCRVAPNVGVLDLSDNSLTPCPAATRQLAGHPGRLPIASVSASRTVVEAWNEPRFASSIAEFAQGTLDVCTSCTPQLRSLHQRFHREAPPEAKGPKPSDDRTSPDRLLPIRAGGLLLDYRCNAACQHCLYASDSRTRAPATGEAITRTVERLARLTRGPRGIHISGGEPFLDLGALEHAVREMVRVGLRIEFVETNGFWGAGRGARESLQGLKEAGLERIRFSASPFHEPFISVTTLRRAIETARGVFGAHSVFVFDRAALESAEGDDLPVDLVPGGRAGYFMIRRQPGKRGGEFVRPCRTELLESGHAHFDGEGNVTPGVCAGISICRIDDLESACCSAVDLSPALRGLVDAGPASLLTLAKERFGYRELESGYAGKCHLCVDVRLHLVRASRSSFPEFAPTAFYEGVERYKAALHIGTALATDVRWDPDESRGQGEP